MNDTMLALHFHPARGTLTRIENAAGAINDLTRAPAGRFEIRHVVLLSEPCLSIRAICREPGGLDGGPVWATLIAEDGPSTPPQIVPQLLLGPAIVYATGMTALGRTALPAARLKAAMQGVAVRRSRLDGLHLVEPDEPTARLFRRALRNRNTPEATREPIEPVPMHPRLLARSA